ncbi:MAG: MCE family protein, partial [Acidimicrobiales bacterium]
MIPRRVWFNLGVFALLFLLLTNWALRNILQLDVVEQPYRVSAVFESSPGLQPNTEVAYLGVRIGTIDSITLDNGQVTIEMDIDRNAQLPEGITAAVLRKSAVGEPYVSLEVPEGYDGGGPYVEPGDDYVIPIERTRVPIAFGDLFRTLDELVSQLPSDDLATVIHEVSVALQGNGPTLRLILESADELTSTLAARSDLFDALADDVIAITHTLAGHSDTITRTWDNLSLFAATLADARADIGALLEGAPRLGDRVAEITTLSSNDIVCTMEGVGSLMNSLAQRESLEGFEAVLDFADEAAAALAAVVHNVIEEDGVERPYLGISIPVDDVLQTLVEGGVDASLAPAPFYEPRPTLPDGPPLAGCGSVSAGPT